ncbi:hypothetical protein HC022_08865 [Salipiger sp. HF18]|nr:hypothetical protein [Salipiger sp. HF18]
MIETERERVDRQSARDADLQLTGYSRAKMRAQFLAGLLTRARGLKDQALIDALSDWIRKRIELGSNTDTSAEDDEFKEEDRLKLAKSAFGIRGIVGISDVHEGGNPPAIGNTPVVGVRWSRVGRDQYADFEKRVVFNKSGSRFIAHDNARLAAFPKPDDETFDSADVLLDLRVEYNEGDDEDKVAFRRRFVPSLVPDLRGRNNTAPSIDDGHIGNVGGMVKRVLATAHLATRFSGLSDGGKVLEFGAPLEWIKKGPDGSFDGRILVIEKWDLEQEPDELAPLPRAFGEIRDADIDDSGLHRIRIDYAPGTSAEDWIGGGIVRLAIAEEKVLFSRGYGINRDVGDYKAARLDVLESGQEDTICYIARYLSPGTRNNETPPKTIPIFGHAGLAIFRVQSSIAPPTPKFSEVQPDEWNIRFTWDVYRSTDDALIAIYDKSNHFEFELQREKIARAVSLRALNGPRSMADIFRALANNDFESVTPAEEAKLATWFTGASPTEIEMDDDPSGSNWLNGRLRIVTEGAAWLAPEPEETGDRTPTLSVPGANMDIERREDYRWRFRARAVENPEDEGFEIFSDWTTTSDWITPLPLKPRFSENGAVPFVRPRPKIPTIRFDIDYELSNRRSKENELANIEYRIVVRKFVPTISGTGGQHGFAAMKITNAIIKPFAINDRSSGGILVRFTYEDPDVAAPDSLPPNFAYAYAFEINQLTDGNVIQKSATFDVIKDSAKKVIVPDGAYKLFANEPRKLSLLANAFQDTLTERSQPQYFLGLDGWHKVGGSVYEHSSEKADISLPTRHIEEIEGYVSMTLSGLPHYAVAILENGKVLDFTDEGVLVGRTDERSPMRLFFT